MDSHFLVPLFGLNDDILEHIIQVAAEGEEGYCNHKSVVKLSHVCTRLRQIILSRSFFWKELEISEETSSDAVEAILRRSQRVPLHISILGVEERLRGSIAPTLFEMIADRLPEAETVTISELQGADGTELALACEIVGSRRGDINLRALTVSRSPLNDAIINLIVGTHLASLSLTFLDEPLVPTLLKIFHLAPNLEVLDVFGTRSGTDLPDSPIPEPSKPAGNRLQVLRMDAGAAEDSEFTRAVELVQLYYPQTILDGHIVEIRGASDSACIDMMQLQRFTEVQSIICDYGREFKIQYSVNCLPTREPVGSHALSELVRQPGGTELVTRGFDVGHNDLHEFGHPARETLRRCIMTARSMTIEGALPLIAVDVLTALALDSWPMLRNISLRLYVSSSDLTEAPTPYGLPVPQRNTDYVDWNILPVDTPQLRSMEITLTPKESSEPSPISEHKIRVWVGVCVGFINAFSYPSTTKFIVRIPSAEKAVNDAVLAAVRQAVDLDPDQITDSLADVAS